MPRVDAVHIRIAMDRTDGRVAFLMDPLGDPIRIEPREWAQLEQMSKKAPGPRQRELLGRILFANPRDRAKIAAVLAGDEGEWLRLVLVVPAALLGIPWEAAAPPKEWREEIGFSGPVAVADRVAVVRRRDQPIRRDEPLFFEPPVRPSRIDARASVRGQTLAIALPSSLRGTPFVDLEPTATAVANAAGRSDFIHFAGHGGPQGLFLGAGGAPQTVASKEVRALLDRSRGAPGSGGRGVRAVVLIACSTAQQKMEDAFSLAAELAEEVPAVVAMQRPVLDDAADLFSSALYAAVDDGLPLEIAVAEGRRALAAGWGMSDALRWWGAPVLYLETEGSAAIPAAPEFGEPFREALHVVEGERGLSTITRAEGAVVETTLELAGASILEEPGFCLSADGSLVARLDGDRVDLQWVGGRGGRAPGISVEIPGLPDGEHELLAVRALAMRGWQFIVSGEQGTWQVAYVGGDRASMPTRLSPARSIAGFATRDDVFLVSERGYGRWLASNARIDHAPDEIAGIDVAAVDSRDIAVMWGGDRGAGLRAVLVAREPAQRGWRLVADLGPAVRAGLVRPRTESGLLAAPVAVEAVRVVVVDARGTAAVVEIPLA